MILSSNTEQSATVQALENEESEDLQMRVYVKIYDSVKYDVQSKCTERVTYDILRFEVVQSEKLSEEFKESGIDKDPYDEYLILYLENDERATYRNSYVDLFRD